MREKARHSQFIRQFFIEAGVSGLNIARTHALRIFMYT